MQRLVLYMSPENGLTKYAETLGHMTKQSQSVVVIVTVTSIVPAEAHNRLALRHLPHVLLHQSTFVLLVGNKNCAIYTHIHCILRIQSMLDTLKLSLTLVRSVPL